MDPWLVGLSALLGVLILSAVAWLVLRWRVRRPSTAAAQVAQLRRDFPRTAECRLVSALVDASYDQIAARAALNDTEEWRAIWDDFAGDCYPADIAHVGDIVRDLDERDRRYNAELDLVVTGPFVALDMVEWARVGVDVVTVSDVARATLCAVERGVRRGDGVALALRPCMSMFGDGRAVLSEVVDTMRQRYGGTLVSVWAAPCNAAVRLAVSAAKPLLAPHTHIVVLTDDDVAALEHDGAALEPEHARMIQQLLPRRQV